MSGIGTCAGKAGKEGSLGTLSTGHPMTAELQHAPWIIETGGKAGQNRSTEVLWVQRGP